MNPTQEPQKKYILKSQQILRDKQKKC